MVVSERNFVPFLPEYGRWESGESGADDSHFCGCPAIFLLFLFALIISCAPISMCRLPL